MLIERDEAMEARRRLMHRLAADSPVCRPTWSLTAEKVNQSVEAIQLALTDITPNGRNVVVGVSPDHRVDKEDQVAREEPSYVEQRTQISSSPLGVAGQ
jgi:hypothetical protein